MVTPLRPRVTEFREDQEQHFEMILLFVAHGINLSDNVREVVEPEDRCADVLRDVYGCAVGAQQHFLVETLVAQIHPHGAVLFSEEYAIFYSFQDDFLAEEISL